MVSPLRSLLVASLFLAIAFPSNAEYRIATVDVNKVVNASKEAKTEKAALDAATEKAKKLIEEKRTALKPLQDKAKSGALVPNSKEAEQLKKQTQDLVQLMREKEDELQKMFAASNKALTEKSSKVIEKFAKDNNYQIVLDKSGTSVRSAVLYGDEGYDITDKIIEKINE